LKQSTKQRIVGTLVLLAVALIFLPVIFDGEGSYQRPLSSRIPNPPLVPILDQPVPTRVDLQGGEVQLSTSTNETALLEPVDVVERDAEPASASPATTASATPAQQPPLEDAVQPTAEAESSTTPVAPQLSFDSQGLPVAWSVRLGAFSNLRNAQNLRERLVAAGYRAYSREIRNANGEILTLVFVGPEQDRDRVESLRRDLQAQFELQASVVRFEVEAL
jgi:DedD protein